MHDECMLFVLHITEVSPIPAAGGQNLFLLYPAFENRKRNGVWK